MNLPSNGRIINNMKKPAEISKSEFLARFNNRAGRFAIDCQHEMIDGKWRLVIKFNNGDREIFHGLKAA